MKKIYTILCWTFCLCMNLNAQVPDSTLEDKIYNVLSELDYSSLQTGIHIDRSPAWVPIELYDGSWSTDSLKSSWNVFHFLYSQLAWAQVNSSAFAPMDSVMNHNMQHLKNQDTTVIGGIWAHYDRFVPWAVDSNLITLDSGICHRVSGAASPFYQQHVFAMALSDDRRDSLVQIVKIDTAWMFTNQSTGWGDLAVDADDGLGWRWVYLAYPC